MMGADNRGAEGAEIETSRGEEWGGGVPFSSRLSINQSVNLNFYSGLSSKDHC